MTNYKKIENNNLNNIKEIKNNDAIDKEILFYKLIDEKKYDNALSIFKHIDILKEKNVVYLRDKHFFFYKSYIEMLNNINLIDLFNKYIYMYCDVIKNEPNNDYKNLICSKLKELEFLYDVNDETVFLKLVSEYKFINQPLFQNFITFVTDYILDELDFKIVSNMNISEMNKIKKCFEIKNNLEDKTIEFLEGFVSMMDEYRVFSKLIKNLLSEFYFQSINYHVIMILNSSYNELLLNENYLILKNKISSLPIKYIDINYQSNDGKTILCLLALLPNNYKNKNKEIYDLILSKIEFIKIDLIDEHNNNLLHYILKKQNYDFLKMIIDNNDNDELYAIEIRKKQLIDDKFGKALIMKNNGDENPISLLFNSNEKDLLIKIIHYIPKEHTFYIIDKMLEGDNFKYYNFDIDIYNQDAYVDYIVKFTKLLCSSKVIYMTNKINKVIILLKLLSNNINLDEPKLYDILYYTTLANNELLFKSVIEHYNIDHTNYTHSKYINKLKNNDIMLNVAIKNKNVDIMEILLKFTPNIYHMNDKQKNSIILALETNNFKILKLINDYMQNIEISDDLGFDLTEVVKKHLEYLSYDKDLIPTSIKHNFNMLLNYISGENV